jgi:hypothetical protein
MLMEYILQFMFINPSFWSFKHQPLVTVAFEYCLMVHVHWSRGGHHVPSVTNAQGQVSVIQMQWSPEAGAKGTFDQADHSTY